ncbi:unnamed protein product [Gulo gulo]|uniref:Uncharacterized protein n=1 Tax=Gulo gulo TaxID=48420 RepID=A0A9X9M7H5_GULGU|nr:unnamed protein product [Gulo gulo]
MRGGGHIRNTVMSPSQRWERPAGYSDAEDEGNSRDGMTGDKNTRKENGKSSLKRNINKAPGEMISSHAVATKNRAFPR